jgi:hypothetical protein
MTILNIKIYKCKGSDDTEFEFTLNQATENTHGHGFISCNLAYDINKFNPIGTMMLLVRGPKVYIQSGQPIEVQQNGVTIYQGIVLSATSKLNGDNDIIHLQLIPSAGQLSLCNFMFDRTIRDQIQKLTGVDMSLLLITGFNAEISTQKLLDVMIANTVYQNQFQHNLVIANDLPMNLRVLSDVVDSKEVVLRKSLQWFNTVAYQQESGKIIIRQLDSRLQCPFSIDYINQGASLYIADQKPCLAVLDREFDDNALSYSTLSSYSILQANLEEALKANNNKLTVSPNYKYFDRVKVLQENGWIIGKIMQIPLNSSFLENPAYTEALKGMQSQPTQYFNSTGGSATAKEFYSNYQRMVTQQAMSAQMSGYWILKATVSIDDAFFPYGVGDIQGTIINIDNAPVKQGIIASYTKEFSASSSFIHMIILPVGTITGFWKG